MKNRSFNKKGVVSAAAIIALSAGLSGCADKHTVSGNIKGLADDTVLVSTIHVNASNEAIPQMDTIVASDGKFTFDTIFEIPSYVILEPQKLMVVDDYGRRISSSPRMIFLMLKPGEKVSVKGEMHDDYVEYRASGSEFNQDFAKMRDTYRASDLKVDSLNMLFADLGSLSPAEQQQRMQRLMHERMESFFESRKEKYEYAKANPSRELAAYYLLQMPLETFGNLYPTLSESVRNGVFADRLSEQNVRYENHAAMKSSTAHIREGNTAPDFTLKDVNGNDFSLRDIKGKYIVIDFWGSWCSWCVKGFPDMKEYYEKYNDRVEFVGIACNDKLENWKEAINEHQLPWVHLKDTDSNDVAKSYGVQGFPTKMIIDPNYKFVYIGVGESKAFYDKLDELLK